MIKPILALAMAALLSAPAAANDAGEKDAEVTLVYEHELPNVPGKSMKGVLVEYGPAASRTVTHTRNPPSSMPPPSKTRSAAKSMTAPSRSTRLAKAFRSYQAIATASAKMPARRNRQSCSPSSWLTRPSRN